MFDVKKYKAKPRLASAIRWNGTPGHAIEIFEWIESEGGTGSYSQEKQCIFVDAARDNAIFTAFASSGDYLVKDNQGRFDVLSEAEFNATYEESDD